MAPVAGGPVPVLQVVLSLNPGGTERLVIELSRRLHAEFPMAVCCLDERGSWGEALRRDGIPVHELGRQPGFHPFLAAKVRTLARRQGAQIVHCHHYSPFVYGALASLLMPDVKVIFTEHGRLSDAPPSRKRRTANRLLGGLADAVTTVSHDLLSHMVREGFDAGAVRVVSNGITVPAPRSPHDRIRTRHLLGLAGDDFVIGSVGRLDPVKDFPNLVDALAALRRSGANARLVLVGDGPERADIEQHVRNSGLTDCVQLLGYRADATDLLCALDLYVNSSIFEGISLTILEAMAVGLPVVATHVGGTSEIVEQGVTGLLTPARDAVALAAAMATLHQSEVMRRAYGNAGRERVVRAFSIERMVAEYAGLYRRLTRSAVAVLPVRHRAS